MPNDLTHAEEVPLDLGDAQEVQAWPTVKTNTG